MAVSDIFLLHALVLDADGSPVHLTQLESAGAEFQQETISHVSAGDTHPRFVACNGAEETIPFTCKQIADVIAVLGNMGADVSPADLYYRKVSNLTGRVDAGTAEHLRFRATLARAYWETLTIGHRQEAMISGRVIPVWDGANDPLIRSVTALTAVPPSTRQGFVLGPVSYGDVSQVKIADVDQVQVNLNPEQFRRSDESDEATTFAAGDTIRPVLNISTTDAAVDLLHRQPVRNLRVHMLRKKDEGCAWLNNELQHVRCTVNRGMYVVNEVAQQPSRRTLTVVAVGDDANGFADNPITWEINVAVALV